MSGDVKEKRTERAKEKKAFECSECHKSKEGSRIPRFWKNWKERYYCDDCWNERYILRAVVMRVVSPLDATWDEVNAALKRMFAETTRFSNWIVLELVKRDVQRAPDMEKLPPLAPEYLYPEARALFPELPSRSITAIQQAVERKYRARRTEVLWRCSAALPTFRYPQPFPVPSQAWAPAIVDDRPQVSLAIGERRFALRLSGGFRYRRQLDSFRLLARDEAQYGELSIYKQDKDLLCKMVAWLPRRAKIEREGTLYVRAAKDALLIGANQKDERLWRYNAQHLQLWQKEHARLLQCWSEDSKAEERPAPRFAERRKEASRKYRHRLNTLAQQAAFYAVAYASRRKFARIEYDDDERGYCEEFVWYALKDRMRTLADERGIEFESKTAEATEAPKEVASG